MKKIYFLLLMVCSVCAFTACSDDDDDTPQCPVKDVLLPKIAQKAGSEFQIAGTGFSVNCEIYLKSTESVKAEVTERLSAAITVKIPSTLAPGNYTVVLKQSGDWELGTLSVTEAEAVCPVTSVALPTGEVEAGTEVEIRGRNFAEGCTITLKAETEGDPVEIENITVSAEGVKFTLPETLPAGTYSVVLTQSGEWPLGEITVVAKEVPAEKQISQFTRLYYKKGNWKNYVYKVTYDEATGKLSKIEEAEDNANGQYASFVWSDNSLTVSVFYADVVNGSYSSTPDETYEFTLNNNGCVTKGSVVSNMGEYESFWTIGTYLEEIEYPYEGGDPAYSKYTMNGDKLVHYTYDTYGFDQNLNYEGEAPANKANLDLLAIVIDGLRMGDFEMFYARLAGICGAKPALLPLNINDNNDYMNQDITYETDNDGYVTKLTLVDAEDETHSPYYIIEY